MAAAAPKPASSNPPPLFRLVKTSDDTAVQGTLVLMPGGQSEGAAAAADDAVEASSAETQPDIQFNIGRDRAYGPLLRLRDMQVSKMHANVYLDSQLGMYCVVDLGSTHGTFVQGDRLSAPKKPSQPRALEHMKLFSLSLPPLRTILSLLLE